MPLNKEQSKEQRHPRLSFLFAMPFLLYTQLFASAMPDNDTLERLKNGEILLIDSASEETDETIHTQAIFHAPAKDVLEIISSCEQKIIYVKGLKKCEVLDETQNRTLVHQVVKTSRFAPTMDFVYESLLDPYSGLNFHLVEGNLEIMQGSWTFTEIPAGTLVDYKLRVRPDLPVPDFIINSDIRKNMPNLMACIRSLADGSDSPEMAKKDLQRCPGKR